MTGQRHAQRQAYPCPSTSFPSDAGRQVNASIAGATRRANPADGIPERLANASPMPARGDKPSLPWPSHDVAGRQAGPVRAGSAHRSATRRSHTVLGDFPTASPTGSKATTQPLASLLLAHQRDDPCPATGSRARAPHVVATSQPAPGRDRATNQANPSRRRATVHCIAMPSGATVRTGAGLGDKPTQSGARRGHMPR